VKNAVLTVLYDQIRAMMIEHRDGRRWASIRTAPYFEGWFHVEVYGQLRRGGGKHDLAVKGFDIPAVTEKPIKAMAKGWYPDLFLYSKKRNTVVWVELKALGLARPGWTRLDAVSDYKESITKTWKALIGLSREGTIAAWHQRRSVQQLRSICGDADEMIALAERSAYALMLAVLIASDSMAKTDAVTTYISKLDQSEVRLGIDEPFLPEYPYDRVVCVGK
jgi:hypothetical protein